MCRFYAINLFFVVIAVSFEGALGIVNGDEVSPHSLPYVVALETHVNDRLIRCGGSLIAANKVLTAATCVLGAENVSVILGAHNLAETENTQVRLESSNFTIHEDYDPETKIDDIAIVYLPKEVSLTDAIATIETPGMLDLLNTYDDKLGLAAGWGKTNDTNPAFSNTLKKVEATIIPYISCTIPYLFKVKNTQICMTGVQERKNICLGDAGGPLIVDGVQVGIASFGSDFGCSVGAPGVYTRLTHYYFWLLKK